MIKRRERRRENNRAPRICRKSDYSVVGHGKAMSQALPFVGNRHRRKATVRQMLEIGVDAIPMVSLMAVCTGFIFAMQGASELMFVSIHLTPALCLHYVFGAIELRDVVMGTIKSVVFGTMSKRSDLPRPDRGRRYLALNVFQEFLESPLENAQNVF